MVQISLNMYRVVKPPRDFGKEYGQDVSQCHAVQDHKFCDLDEAIKTEHSSTKGFEIIRKFGFSLKDAGKKCFELSLIDDDYQVSELMKRTRDGKQ